MAILEPWTNHGMVSKNPARRRFLLARIAHLGEASNRQVERVFEPTHKDSHWSRRKLAQVRR